MRSTIIVKIGTSSLTQPETGELALSTITSLAETLCQLRRESYNVILVSSGAVGFGCACLQLTERPESISLKQAIASVGQVRLMRVYDDVFTTLQQPIAQVLLTRSDFIQRSRYLNVYNTLQELLSLGVVPVVNENDTVAVDELKFGDNDMLSALVASLVKAETLFLLTDVDSLYSADPRYVANAKPIPLISSMEELNALQIETGNSSSKWGTGGMMTKITAARIATTVGIRTVITEGCNPWNIVKILQGEAIGTHFAPHPEPKSARNHWIVYGLVPGCKLYLDCRAVTAITKNGKSLLAEGINTVEGVFDANDSVQLCNKYGTEIARGLVNYSSQELKKICGCCSDDITSILGYEGTETVIHKDNLILI